MDNHPIDTPGPEDLRSRASRRLTGTRDPAAMTSRAVDALTALHALATSPSTAEDALALLHELQVHQVELDLQAEELRDSRAELEAMLRRQVELHDFQPAGCFSVDAQLVIRELNLRGAGLLGVSRDSALGLRLDTFFSADAARTLRGLIEETVDQAWGLLSWRKADAVTHSVRAGIARDPSGSGFLVSLLPA